MKRVILITGTPGVGKTTTARVLAVKLGAICINLTDYAKTHGLTLGEDKERQTSIVDEKAMYKSLSKSISATETDIIIDGHYAAAVTPAEFVTHVFVLRRNPAELKEQMQHCGFSEAKINENLSAEILDSCLIEALQNQQDKVCELDVSGQTTDDIVEVMLKVLNNTRKCYSGFVDWLGMLERENITDKYLS
ncbi:MAG: adenylate kinase family protein [Nitrososphaerota archaeon]|jgi:adenylate kinase|uniref:adenylate kinase family protein n=1 Tax=Candidatus Bathycorpusculum sp. TaxID=2994959 RepID=UPI0028310C05|nr:adenylate kinase family protein [Candidatus Termitimicrobium sp.]MCL2432260.1 adenylate kinase family protein [Candidatus Termitimicrobium sp.]MDR0493103.1 adenylate kinase family protein [Nitrososphaerota archaeon]